jgi:DNA-binding IclR family transcriptional regulator
MAVIESLASGIKLLEIVAMEHAPAGTPDIIKKCESFLSDASVRNTLETLAGMGWLQKVVGKGGIVSYGLGEKAARLWQVYVNGRIAEIERVQAENQRTIDETKRMIELL